MPNAQGWLTAFGLRLGQKFNNSHVFYPRTNRRSNTDLDKADDEAASRVGKPALDKVDQSINPINFIYSRTS